jgi:hypothetical protein
LRLGLVVDGESEFKSLPLLYPALSSGCGAQILTPILAKMMPTAPVPVIARACTQAIRQLDGRRADKIIVLLDHESQDRCPPQLAADLQLVLAAVANAAVDVVIKDRMFENWLVADCNALASQRARFEMTPARRRRVQDNKADAIDALRLIKEMCIGPQYHKVQDSARILSQADPMTIATHSRSFRRFLRALDHPPYRTQSRRAA